MIVLGFLYGDSLYEVIFVRDNVPLFWQDHFARMHRSAFKMKMTISQTDIEIRKEILKTIDTGYHLVLLI